MVGWARSSPGYSALRHCVWVPARIRGCNRIRMQRMGFTEEEIDAVEAALTGSEARYPDRLQRYVEDFDAVWRDGRQRMAREGGSPTCQHLQTWRWGKA